MPDAPTTRDEIDAWLITLLACARLHTATRGPDGTWIVARTPEARPRILADIDEALAFIADEQHRARLDPRQEAA